MHPKEYLARKKKAYEQPLWEDHMSPLQTALQEALTHIEYLINEEGTTPPQIALYTMWYDQIEKMLK